MSSFDRKFAVIQPTLDRLSRKPLEVNNTGLINPQGTSPVPLIDGELVQVTASYKWDRASDPAKPSFFCIEDRGDTGVQASRKLSAILGGGAFEADTIVFDSTSLVLGSALMQGTVNTPAVGSVARSGLILRTGSNIVIGYVMRLPTTNGNLLRFIQTLV